MFLSQRLFCLFSLSSILHSRLCILHRKAVLFIFIAFLRLTNSCPVLCSLVLMCFFLLTLFSPLSCLSPFDDQRFTPSQILSSISCDLTDGSCATFNLLIRWWNVHDKSRISNPGLLSHQRKTSTTSRSVAGGILYMSTSFVKTCTMILH